LRIARIWKASATESSGGTPLGEESINAVPARFARSRFVVSGTTRIDWRTRVSVSLCQITTGRRPVCSRGRCLERAGPLRQTLLRSSALPAFASLGKSQRPATGRRTTIKFTLSPGRRPSRSTGRSTPFS
jgi:hypothetical protein